VHVYPWQPDVREGDGRDPLLGGQAAEP